MGSDRRAGRATNAAHLLRRAGGGIHTHVNAQRPKLGTAPILAAILLAGVSGCPGEQSEPTIKLQQQVDSLTVEHERLGRELENTQAALTAAEDRIRTLQNLPKDVFFFSVDRIELDRMTGGADYDGKPGDDGVTVYLRPRDADGDVLKAAGEIKVQLFDLTEKPAELGLYLINDPEELRKSWLGKFLTNYYVVKCPWDPKIGPPTHSEVTVRVTFLDYLTGRVFVESKLLNVTLAERPGAARGRTPATDSHEK